MAKLPRREPLRRAPGGESAAGRRRLPTLAPFYDGFAGRRPSPDAGGGILGDALKATTTLLYMSHPAALAYVGAYSGCARPHDPLRIEVRPGLLGSTAERA